MSHLNDFLLFCFISLFQRGLFSCLMSNEYLVFTYLTGFSEVVCSSTGTLQNECFVADHTDMRAHANIFLSLMDDDKTLHISFELGIFYSLTDDDTQLEQECHWPINQLIFYIDLYSLYRISSQKLQQNKMWQVCTKVEEMANMYPQNLMVSCKGGFEAQ